MERLIRIDVKYKTWELTERPEFFYHQSLAKMRCKEQIVFSLSLFSSTARVKGFTLWEKLSGHSVTQKRKDTLTDNPTNGNSIILLFSENQISRDDGEKLRLIALVCI